MIYEIRVDHVAGICIWKSRRHLGMVHESLPLGADLQMRIKDWISRMADLYPNRNDESRFDDWLDYDAEGEQIARELKPYLGRDAQVLYYRESTEERVPI